MPHMTDAERDAFLAGRRYGILSTLDNDGSPVSVPVWYWWDGRILRLFTHTSTPKVKYLRRDPRASLLVTNFPDEAEAWVRFDGEIVMKPGGLTVAEEVLDRYYPEGDRRRGAIEEWHKEPDNWIILEMTALTLRTYRD
jgi:PPOX class probable F420-dependent enzyme